MASVDGPATTINGVGTVTSAEPSGINRQAPPVRINGVGTVTTASLPDQADNDWSWRIVDENGALAATLPTATVGSITRKLNQPRRVQGVTVPATDPAVALLNDGTVRELQGYRGSTLMFFGPLGRPRYSNQRVTVDASGPLSHLSRRVVGDEETNELTDPDFDQQSWNSPGGWTISKVSHDVADPAYIIPADFGAVLSPLLPAAVRSFRIYNSNENADVYLSVFQDLTLTAGAFDMQVAFVAYIQLAAAPAYTATQGMGMALGMKSVALAAAPGPSGIYMQAGGQWDEYSTATIDPADMVRETWHRLATQITVPAGETRELIAEIACPDGETVYIAQHPRVVTSEGLEYKATDISRVIDGLIDHAHDAAGFNKSALNLTITGAEAPNTGIDVDRNYPYALHRNIWSAVQEFTDETVDIACVPTPTTRPIRVYYPHKGSYREKARLEVRPQGGNCELVSWVFDSERASNRPFLFGAGSGIGRDIGYARDGSAHGGTTLESVEYADPISTLGNLILTQRAEEKLETLKEPEVLTVRTFAGDTTAEHLYGVTEGDWVPVRIWFAATDDTATFDLGADYRIVEMVTEPVSDTVTFTLNRRDVP